jgi:hypothetical protein
MQQELMMQRFGNLKTQGLGRKVSLPQLSCSLYLSLLVCNASANCPLLEDEQKREGGGGFIGKHPVKIG